MKMGSQHRKTKLLGLLGNKGSSRIGGKTDDHRLTRVNESDPVKAMQDRMLHSALHNRGTYQSDCGVTSTTYKPVRPYSNVKPPRGTLSNEKLPYLDWRLSLLLLCQVQSDEEERQKTIKHEDICPQQSSAGNQFDSHSDSSTGQQCEERDGRISVAVAMSSDQWYHSTQEEDGKCQDELFTKNAVHHALLTNDALAAVPLLERDVHCLYSDMIPDGEESQADMDGQARSAPLLPASLFHRASFGLRSTAAERGGSTPSIASTPKLNKLFNRGNNRLSHFTGGHEKGFVTTLPKSADRLKLGEVTVNNLFYNDSHSKPKKKWSLMALHNVPLYGSQMARETEMML